MAKQIDKLTPEQEQELVQWREEWLAVGLATGPVDRAAAQEAMRRAYIAQKYPPPKQYFWVDSPNAGCELAAKLTGEPASKQLYKAGYGQHDVFWLAFWAFVQKLGAEGDADPWPLLDLARNCGWYWTLDEAAILTERPVELFRDAQNRLHRTDGLAIRYPDGWGVACVNGTRIPTEWVTVPGALNGKVALTHDNAEQRLAAATILGWDKILSEVKAKIVQRDDNPEIGELLEVDLPDAPRSKFLRVRCGTGRTFSLPVPAEMTSALQANAWTYSLEEHEFKPTRGFRT